MEKREDELHSDVILSRTQATGVVTRIKLGEDMRKQIHETVVAETRTITRERFLLIPRIAAMYVSGIGAVLFGSLSVVASMIGFQTFSTALLTPTLIAAISAVTLSYVLHKEAP
jgi:hypothetical protein